MSLDYEAVVFDMDGVIFDSERVAYECWIKLAKKYGFEEISVPYYKCIGTTGARTREIMMEAYGPDFPYEKFKDEVGRIFKEEYGGGRLPVKVGVKEIFEFLKGEKKKIALASSTKTEILTVELKEAGLYDYFDEIVGGDMIKNSKPHPEIFLLACKKLGVDPKKAVAIEDSYNGIKSAFSGGLMPIMVPDMLPANDEMKELAVAVLDSLIEVKSFLKTD